MVDYRSRWQSRRRRRTHLRRSIAIGVALIAAGIVLLLRGCGRPATVWTYRPLSEGVPHFVLSDGKLFAAWSSGEVRALEVTTGKDAGLVGYRRPFAFAGCPAVAGGILVVGCDDCQVHAVSAETGQPLWRYETRGPVQAQPVIDQDQVLVGSDDGYLYCLDLLSGVLLWKTDCGGGIGGAAAVAGKVVVVGTVQRRLVGVDRGSGQRLWTLPTAAAVLGPARAIDDNTVTVGCDDGKQYIVPVTNHQSASAVDIGGLLRLPPLVDGDRLYVASHSGKVVAAALGGGELLWQRELGQTVSAGLAADDRYLYVGTLSGQVFALHCATGKVRRRWQLDEPVNGSLVTAGDLLITGLGDGRIIALPLPKR